MHAAASVLGSKTADAKDDADVEAPYRGNGGRLLKRWLMFAFSRFVRTESAAATGVMKSAESLAGHRVPTRPARAPARIADGTMRDAQFRSDRL